MRVLITGACGFAGSHLVRHCLDRGAEVHGAGRRKHAGDPAAQSVSYIRADLADPDQARHAVRVADPDRVFHLAAKASVAHSWQRPGETIEENLTSTLNVLEAVRAHAGAARVLVAGSAECYGEPDYLPVDESHQLRPRNPYALSKTCADLAAGLYADGYGIHVVRARSFNHAGPGQAPDYVVSSFARQIAKAEADAAGEVEIVTGNLGSRRDFTDVRDVVWAYWLALEQPRPGVYNVCSGKTWSAADILAGLTGLTDVHVDHRTDAKLLREGEVLEIRGAHDRLTQATGWDPRIPFEETLADTLGFWRERFTQ
jgi:GDP-4-dehydro-6-deoxy-D-mannose reductase